MTAQQPGAGDLVERVAISTPTIIMSPTRQKLNQPFTGYRLTAATRAALAAIKESPDDDQ